MYRSVVVVLALLISAEAGPLNLFVNVTIDDRPDLDIVEGDIAYDANGRNAYIVAAKWSGGLIPYLIESTFTATQSKVFTDAMRTIERQTGNCIRFVQRTTEPTWIRIYSGSGCWSYMGKTKTSGAQDLSLSTSGCIYQRTAIHELLHAAGIAHEQTRPDRDSYVTINWGNIQSGTESNFQSYSTSQVNTFKLAYDYASVMHYGWNAFSKNGLATITPKQANISQNNLGSSQQMTTLDIQKIKAHYNCP